MIQKMKLQKGSATFKLFIMSLLICLALLGCSSTKEVEKESMKVTIGDQEFTGLYTGTLVKKLAKGEAFFSITNTDGKEQWEYKGEFTESKATGGGQVKDMPMTVKFQEEEYAGVYSGAMQDGLASGEGSFQYKEDMEYLKYKGNFEEGKIKGKGTLDISFLRVDFEEVSRTGPFKGDTVDFLPEGKGSFSAVNDKGNKYTYTGDWKNGKWDGQGKCVYMGTDSSIEYGTFKNNEYTPTYAEFLQTKGSSSSIPFTVSDKNIKYIEQNEKLFPSNKYNNIANEVVSDITFKKLKKNVEKFSGRLISTGSCTINYIDELHYKKINFTRIILSDSSNNIYYVFYNGSSKYYEGDHITVYGLPLEYSNYTHVDGGKTACVVMAGSYIK